MSTIIIITPKKRNVAAESLTTASEDRTSVFTNVPDDVVEKITSELSEACDDRINAE